MGAKLQRQNEHGSVREVGVDECGYVRSFTKERIYLFFNFNKNLNFYYSLPSALDIKRKKTDLVSAIKVVTIQ